MLIESSPPLNIQTAFEKLPMESDSCINYIDKLDYSLCKPDDGLVSLSFLKYPTSPPIAYEIDIITLVNKSVSS